MTSLAIFASGSGSNAENIAHYLENRPDIEVKFVIYNRREAGVVNRMERLKIPSYYFSNSELREGKVLEFLKAEGIDFIILAGFLAKIPSDIVFNFPEKILNIHPALLPKFGGKGMYGENIYKAVLENKEAQSGISVHFVNQNYDEGKVIFQKSFNLSPEENLESLTAKIHELEQSLFPKIIEKIILK